MVRLERMSENWFLRLHKFCCTPLYFPMMSCIRETAGAVFAGLRSVNLLLPKKPCGNYCMHLYFVDISFSCGTGCQQQGIPLLVHTRLKESVLLFVLGNVEICSCPMCWVRSWLPPLNCLKVEHCYQEARRMLLLIVANLNNTECYKRVYMHV
jgi:hypothetical protein